MRKPGLRERVLLRLIDRHGHVTLRWNGLLNIPMYSAAEQLRLRGVLSIESVTAGRVRYVRSGGG